MAKKLDIYLKYNRGVFNSKNEQILAQAVNVLKDKINELIDEIEQLKKQQNETPSN